MLGSGLPAGWFTQPTRSSACQSSSPAGTLPAPATGARPRP